MLVHDGEAVRVATCVVHLLARRLVLFAVSFELLEGADWLELTLPVAVFLASVVEFEYARTCSMLAAHALFGRSVLRERLRQPRKILLRQYLLR